MPGKVSALHLSRKAYIYVRQSSAYQVAHHHEGRQVQYNLVERARQLGWSKQQIVITDEDLATSASDRGKRSGFEELLSRICRREVGGLIFLYASRLARNGEEWHRALNFCCHFETLIIDREGVYDPRLPSDRLLLGMQGSFSEYEQQQMQLRSWEAQMNKAARGQLFRLLPAGLVKTEDERLELDPDRRIRDSIRLVFRKFEELGSIRQVCKWFGEEVLEVPVRDAKHSRNRIIWKVPGYSILQRILTNPLYAGIYQYPKTRTITRLDAAGKLVKSAGHRPGDEDKVILIEGLFEGYISPEQFYRNQQEIRMNANMKGNMSKGAPRSGCSLLAGLLRCGECGRKLLVRYSSARSASYYCPGKGRLSPHGHCLRFSGRLLEGHVIEQILTALQPEAIRAALIAEEKFRQARQQKSDAIHQALEQAAYEAGRIERQFNAVEPENSLVFHTLTERWQAALEKVANLKERHQQSLSQSTVLDEGQRQRLFELAGNLKKLWDHPHTDAATKTRLVRTLIREIWIAAPDDHHLMATIYWQGGVHTQLQFQRYNYPDHRKVVKDQRTLTRLIVELAAICEDQQIARILNRLRHAAPDGKSWSEPKVIQFRNAHQIAAFCATEYQQRGLLNLRAAAKRLNVNAASLRKLIDKGILKARQVIKYAPWEIDRHDLDAPAVQQALQKIKSRPSGGENSVSRKS